MDGLVQPPQLCTAYTAGSRLIQETAMKRLFAVTWNNASKPTIFYSDKRKAKKERDKVIAAGNATAHITYGPDHRNYKS
jgi:hypothetical protein